MARRTPDPTLVVLHKRLEALTKRVEKLDREVFKTIRIDAENTMPDLQEEVTQQQQEIAQVVNAMMGSSLRSLGHEVERLHWRVDAVEADPEEEE